MSIPKEPRQLMINLMYLVLTALLALNVSAEVMNAFFTIDKSIENTNGILSTSNEKTLEGLSKVVREKTNYKPLYDAARQAREIVSAFNTSVDNLRSELETEAGGVFPEDYKEPIKRGRPMRYQDKEIPTRFFVDGVEAGPGGKKAPKGPELKSGIESTRKALVDLVNDVAKMEIEGTRITDEEIADLQNKLALSIDNESWKTAGKSSWEQFVFGYMPVAACYPILRKLQNDARSSEATVINFLASKVGETVIEFDRFEPVASAPKGYVIKGEPFTAEIFLSAFSSQAAEGISMRVNGASLPIKDGKGQYTTSTSSIGEKEFKVDISVTNPFTKKVDTYSKAFRYEVGERSVAVSADKMNVFYIGVDNPVSVSAAGISSNELTVGITGGGGSISPVPGTKGQYVVNVKEQSQDCRITVSGGGMNDSKQFRVKRIPNPVAKLSGSTGGEMASGEFKAQGGLAAILENFDFDARCEIQGYELVYAPARQDVVPSVNAGGRYTDKTLRLVQQAKPGDRYFFENVKAKCPGDNAGRLINSLVFKIK
jgi:gliding motility-associated protein GldM